MILTACSTTTDTKDLQTTANDRAITILTCQVFQPINWADTDTKLTLAQVKEHNAAWASICSNNTTPIEKNHEPI